MDKLLLDAELYKETAQSSPVLNEFVWNQGDLLNSSCSDEEDKQRDTSSLICIFQQFLLLTSHLPENIQQVIKLHLLSSKQNVLTFL